MIFNRLMVKELLLLLLCSATISAQQWIHQESAFPAQDSIPKFVSLVFGSDQIGYLAKNFYWNNTSKKTILRTTNSGLSWETIKSDSMSLTSYFLFTDRYNRLFVPMGNSDTTMMYTTNTGITWNSTTIPDRFGFLHFFDSSQGIAFGPLRRYFTSDGGVSWNVGGDTTDRIASGSDYAVQGNQNIWMVSPVSIIGTDIGFIAKSTDGGKNWVYQDSMSYMLFGVDFIDSFTGFAVGGGHFNNNGYLYSTIDGGLHWKITTFNATGDLIDVAFLDSIHGWIISENTIYRTTNGGISWEVQKTIPGINFEKVFISKNDHFGYIIGSYPGRKKHILLVADLNIPLHRDIDNVKEPVLDVLNNYPNPFNSSTTIKYSIKTAGRVQIQVTSILGEVIATLINESKSPGEYQTVWNGKSDQGQYVGSGVYFIKFSNFNTTRSIKIQYLK